jgi:hypothetical protein
MSKQEHLSPFELFDAVLSCSMGMLFSRWWYLLLAVIVRTDPLPFTTWLPLYTCQDLLFYLCHAGYHHMGLFGKHAPWIPRLLLPLHSNHHHRRQTMFSHFSYLFLESPVFFSLCASVQFLCVGWRGVFSSLVQQSFTFHVTHTVFHAFKITQHMNHHATRACNFGSEFCLWDLLFDTYNGKLMLGTAISIRQPQVRNRSDIQVTSNRDGS